MCVRMYTLKIKRWECLRLCHQPGLSLSVLSQLLKGRASHSTTNYQLSYIEVGEIAPRGSSNTLVGGVESESNRSILEGVIWNRKPLARWRFYSFRWLCYLQFLQPLAMHSVQDPLLWNREALVVCLAAEDWHFRWAVMASMTWKVTTGFTLSHSR